MTATADAPGRPDTAPIVPSYVQGRWWTPSDAGVQDPSAADVHDASTGHLIRRVSTDGLDLAAVVEYARTTGRAGIQAMTFHERALALKHLALFLTDRKQGMYELAAATGATKRDNFVDIDGGIGVLFTYGSKGRREMPNSTVMIDGPFEPIAKDGSFGGEHVFTSIPGVAAQINAFNFPVWGMLEKFAPAFLAGLPSIVKPATPTAYVTEACVRLMVESGILPEGSIQLISGSARTLQDHLDYRDALAFTGSASTADLLRSHPSVQHGGLRFTAEADSLNAAILGPDAAPDTPEFEAFVKSVFAEMTAKAGQKCTAIRRIIVPAAVAEDFTAALRDRLSSRVVVGDPREEATTMGPLASLDQLEDVRGAIASMVAAGGRAVIGNAEAADGARAAEADGGAAQTGAFMEPVLLAWDDPRCEAAHTIEAFGPVSSLFTYDTLEEAVELAALGRGSLVATVCTNDPEAVRTLALGIAGHHGRIHLLNRDDARTSTGHGSPLPHFTHGGPGRAGGGEELGGIRAVKHYMQRSAIQGSPDQLTAVTGVWHAGARRIIAGCEKFGASADAVHPFRRALDTLRVGHAFASDLRTVRPEDIAEFAESTGDVFYAHTNPEAAAANEFFPGIVAHGYLLVSWAAGLFVAPGRSPVLANYGLENLRFITPVAEGDSVRVMLTAKEIRPRVDADYGEVVWDAVLYNQDEEIVATYDVLTLVAKEESQALGG
ncbi:phenylacetic acid degradation bifunctional protein PaaZ [Helcobacillus sp. ACRRO]|uniref:phenylacetic acid degradation bifunctional protein PaaZ n=1 Tax=Helcobacillus sp. ACRRO TaxID=2918202 RepID=UPI001EF66286|nr:phenylacetic acid degradation bifunctional protein PaaZ [Helcobacillus sp. ACRRO]MCG7427820.1 phenylacetic acid degradation bifunctional protein PaaZ [Helcobacillus sp. ACRRO]